MFTSVRNAGMNTTRCERLAILKLKLLSKKYARPQGTAFFFLYFFLLVQGSTLYHFFLNTTFFTAA
jgi:hypothetical protein